MLWVDKRQLLVLNSYFYLIENNIREQKILGDKFFSESSWATFILIIMHKHRYCFLYVAARVEKASIICTLTTDWMVEFKT